MSWIPKYIIEGGMYGGRMCPAGTLSGLIAICNVSVSESVNCAKGLGGHNTTQSPYVTWQGGFGMTDDLLKEYITSHADDQYHEFLLAELSVENPEGAQFYKQTLTIWCRIKARLEHEESGDDSVDYWYYEVAITKICRREYPTPYSAWTELVLTDLDASMNGTYYKTGKKEVGGYWTYYTTGMKIAISPFSYNNNDYFGIGIYQETERADNDDIRGNQEFILGIKETRLDEVFNIEFEPEKQEDPNEPPEDPPGPGEGGDSGGGGDHVLPNEPVPVPPLPDVAPCDISWLTVYKMASTELSEFGQEMMEPDLWEALTQFFNNPLEAIVSIVMCPVNAPSSRSKTPEVGRGPLAKTWTHAYPVVDNQYVEVDCGSISISPYWKSAFDYDPYTKFTIFLPFIGFKTLKSDEIMGRTIGVKYHFDVCTGDCVAFVYRTSDPGEYGQGPTIPGVVASFNGNCGIRVPISRQSADAAINATMGLMAQGVGLASNVAGSFMGGAGDLTDDSNMHMSQISNQISSATMTAVNGLKQHIERSGNLGGSPGYMGILNPYIIREIPRQILPRPNESYYWKLEGYPANIGGTLGDMIGTGLQVVESIQLNNIPALENERREIISWLGKGVIV